MSAGDHLFYYRAGGVYSHHGIDCGDGMVIHYESSPWMKLAGSCRVAGHRSTATTPRIARVTWDEFALGSDVFVRDYPAECDAAEQVLARARGRIGEACYDIFGNNCEHFAVWCKTGIPHSTQVHAHHEATRALWNGYPIGAALLRSARRVPRPYRVWAYAGAFAAAGVVYAGTYVVQRRQHAQQRMS